MMTDPIPDDYNSALYYDCCDSESYAHETPEGAIAHYLEQDQAPDVDTVALIARHSPIEVTAYVRAEIHPRWPGRMADQMIEGLAEDFGEQYGGRDDGKSGIEEEALKAFGAALEIQIAALVEEHATVWACRAVGKRTYSAAEVEALMREYSPAWFAAVAPHADEKGSEQ